MKSALNLIRGGTAGLMCLSLLAACDGRGVTPFKAKKGEATPAQIAEYCKTATADVAFCKAQFPPQDPSQNPPAGPATLDPNAPVNPGSSSNPLNPSGPPTVNGGGEAPPAPVDPGSASAEIPPVTEPGGLITDGAKSKGFIEREELARDLYGKDGSQGLIEKVDELVSKGPSVAASAILKQISFNGDSKSQPLRLSLRAQIESVKGPAYLQVDDAQVIFPENGKMYPLVTELHEVATMEDPAKDPGNAVLTYAYCASAACKHIQVLIDFAVANGRAEAAFILEVKADGFNLLSHNIENLKSFGDETKATEPGANTDGEKTEGEKTEGEGKTTGPVTADPGSSSQSTVDPKSSNAEKAAAAKKAEEEAKKQQEQAGDLDKVEEPEVDLRSQGIDGKSGNIFDNAGKATQDAVGKTPSFRQAEEQSMAAYKKYQESKAAANKQQQPAQTQSFRQAENQSMAAYKQYVESKAAANKQQQPAQTQSFRQAEVQSMAAYKQYQESKAAANKQQQTAQTQSFRQAEEQSMAAYKQYQESKVAANKQQQQAPSFRQAEQKSMADYKQYAEQKAAEQKAAEQKAAEQKRAEAYKQYAESRIQGEKEAAAKKQQEEAQAKPAQKMTTLQWIKSWF